jgi:PAS domain S-box-containing protein
MFNTLERQAGLLDLVSDAIIVCDFEGQIIYWNRGAETLYGWSREQAVGRVSHELLRTTFPIPLQSIKNALRDTRHWDGDLHQTIRDGSMVIVSSRWAVRDTETNELQILESNRDITAQKRTQQAFVGVNRELTSRVEELQRSERRFRAFVDLAPDAVVIANGDGTIVLVNLQTEKQFGYTRDELVGESLEMLLPARFRTRHPKHRSEYMSNPRVRSMGDGLDLYGLRKNGEEFPVEISLSPIEIAEGVLISSTIRDVSQRNRLGTALGEKNILLEAADHAKDLFLASMSHELRTPLQVIIGFADLLAEEVEGPLTGKQKRSVAHILDGSQHLLKLLNDILDLSKIEAGEMRLRLGFFDTADAIKEMVTSVQLQVKAKSILLETSTNGCQMLHADPLRFKQILGNLLGNAIKFTPVGGRISITATLRNGFIEIRVSDTGIGIAKEEQEAVFDKFHQVGATISGPQPGTGLGLSITRALVEGHGGRIWLESESGKGSHFIFTIPSTQQQAAFAECGSRGL